MSDVTPLTYANRLASYISDPSTIRVRTLEYFGVAPPLEVCRQLRTEHERRAAAERALRLRDLEDADRTFQCGHPLSMENTGYRGEREFCIECFKEKTGIEPEYTEDTVTIRQEISSGFEDTAPEPDGVILTASGRVLKAASKFSGIPVADIVGPSRLARVIRVRFAVALTLRRADIEVWSFSHIASVLGGRDHSTIIHGIKRAEYMERDPAFRDLMAELTRAYHAKPAPLRIEGALAHALFRKAA